jgi:hypothetical protein
MLLNQRRRRDTSVAQAQAPGNATNHKQRPLYRILLTFFCHYIALFGAHDQLVVIETDIYGPAFKEIIGRKIAG